MVSRQKKDIHFSITKEAEALGQISCKIFLSQETPNDFGELSGHLKQNGLWILGNS